MGPLRTLLASSLVIASLLACLAPRKAAASEQISARELLVLAQEAGDHRYRFDQATAARLERTEVQRPAAGAGRAELEASLSAAGFSLRPVGPPEQRLLRIEPSAD